jgi:hypothetical protein
VFSLNIWRGFVNKFLIIMVFLSLIPNANTMDMPEDEANQIRNAVERAIAILDGGYPEMRDIPYTTDDGITNTAVPYHTDINTIVGVIGGSGQQLGNNNQIPPDLLPSEIIVPGNNGQWQTIRMYSPPSRPVIQPATTIPTAKATANPNPGLPAPWDELLNPAPRYAG